MNRSNKEKELLHTRKPMAHTSLLGNIVTHGDIEIIELSNNRDLDILLHATTHIVNTSFH